MKVASTPLPGVLLLEPRLFRDERGFFLETWQQARYAACGIAGPFVQDNLSRSVRGTLRGLHFQEPQPQGKLVSVVRGAVYDVAVDIRRGSPTFGQWVAEELTADNRRQLWIPEGFAHGFLALQDETHFLYKTTDIYARDCERSIRWDDPAIGIQWPLPAGLAAPRVAPKDAGAPLLAGADLPAA